jgi:hypothetical protein
MSSNKRRRTEDAQPSTSPRLQQLRLSAELASKLGTQYCPESDLITMMLSQKICSRVSTFHKKEEEGERLRNSRKQKKAERERKKSEKEQNKSRQCFQGNNT